MLALLTWLWIVVHAPVDPDRLGITPLVRKPIPASIRRRPLREPRIRPWLLPYRGWEEEVRQYFRHLTGEDTTVLHPRMIVMHYTVTATADGVWNSFANGGPMDHGDYGYLFGHPSVHFMIDHDGTIYQLLPTDFRCTGAYGVNHLALSIENVALDEDDLLSRPEQVYAGWCLVDSLCRRYHIPLDRVVSHNDVSFGRLRVPQYLDRADHKWPYCYPPKAFRYDPGPTYMGWLKRRLRPPAGNAK